MIRCVIFFQLCLVTLSLFDTLVNLNCEDFMLELILRYVVEIKPNKSPFHTAKL